MPCIAAHSRSHTHSWHSVEIFSSLVLPRKILTRAPKFPVRGLFSTKGKWKREIISSIVKEAETFKSEPRKHKRYVSCSLFQTWRGWYLTWLNCWQHRKINSEENTWKFKFSSAPMCFHVSTLSNKCIYYFPFYMIMRRQHTEDLGQGDYSLFQQLGVSTVGKKRELWKKIIHSMQQSRPVQAYLPICTYICPTFPRRGLLYVMDNSIKSQHVSLKRVTLFFKYSKLIWALPRYCRYFQNVSCFKMRTCEALLCLCG